LTVEEEVQRAARLLEALIQAAGVPHKELEVLLEVAPGYVERVLSGRIELKLRHILTFLRALEIEPSLFFEALYPISTPETSAVDVGQLRDLLQGFGFEGESVPAPPEVGRQDLERLLRNAVRAAMARRDSRRNEI
jgi:transcriptional regulator with XRE-family HTH domain